MRALASLLFATAAVVVAQEPAATFGHSRHGAEFDEGPRQAARRMAGLNDRVHVPVAGLDAEAQAFFDQGIVQLHGFWYFEAERSFREVLRRAPGCAMAQWGIALANFENAPRAAQCIANAVRDGAAVPRYEQLWIDAFAAFHGIDDAARTELRSGDAARVQKAKDALAAANKDRKKDVEEKAYRQLLKDLGTIVFEFPDDLEAKALLAIYVWHAYDWGAGIPIVSHAAVDALLEAVFAKVPDHPAHHYRIHLWDAEKAERALRSAAAIGASAPAIAHQWHMAGHIYAKLHRHAEASWQQEASARVDHAHMAAARVMPFAIHNYGHNQEWLARSESYLGSARDALATARNLAAIPRHPKWNTLDDDRHIAAYARKRLVQVCEDFEMWHAVLELDASGELDATDSVTGEVLRLGSLGRAHFRLGRADDGARVMADADALLVRARALRAAAVDKAEDEAVARKAEPKQRREALAEAGRQPTDTVQSVLDLRRELRGEQLLAQGDAKGALVEFEAVKDFPKTLLADAHLAAGNAAKAVELLEHENKERPNRFATEARLFLALVSTLPDDPAERAKKPELRERIYGLMPRLGVRDGDEADSPLQARLDIGVSACGAPATPKPGPSQRYVDEEGRPLFEWRELGADFGARPPIGSLGPLRWQPFAHTGFDLPRADGERFTLAPAPGKPTLVVFYLGFQCLQCVEQLHALRKHHADLAALGLDVVAIGDQDLPALREALAALPADQRPPFPLLADPARAAFRAWHCFDEFEDVALHGTFVVDAAGKVRWADTGAAPFTDFTWLAAECRRLLAPGARRVATLR